MADYPNHQQVPFWDFVRSFDQQQNNQQNGAGVDHHPAGPPFGGFGNPWAGAWNGPWGYGPHEFGGRGGWGRGRGRHGHGHGHTHHAESDGGGEEGARSRTASPAGEHVEGEEGVPSAGDAPEHGHRRRGPRGFGRGGRHGHGFGEHSGDESAAAFGEGYHGSHHFGGRRGGSHGHCRGGPQAGGWAHRGHAGRWGRGGHRGPPPFGGPGAAFDLSGLFASLNANPAISGNPWAQIIRQVAEQAGIAQPQNGAQQSGETLFDADAESTFVPPVDIFNTETAYILHIAIPGAKKEDVGVNWDADKSELNIAGVVYRQGDEEFLKTLSTAERKVGMFERSVKLPPGNVEKEEVDEDAIVAKLEDGVLVVTVPKVEKEWTEVKKVAIN